MTGNAKKLTDRARLTIVLTVILVLAAEGFVVSLAHSLMAPGPRATSSADLGLSVPGLK